ncbi:MAG: ribosome recycling factor [Coriobacteriales bacterium]|jgi:ribosome recycling factor|nr:ribosome recycling factor [Coriobacteriales bacterium]MDO5708798.1 ribosome recycling factor [Coriobacteriales bacterium]
MSEFTDSARAQMNKCIDALRHNFAKVRTGRANAHVLDDIRVDYYGVPTPIVQLAGIKVPEASLLVIEPWDKSSLRSIERAIMDSDVGITPSNDGICIRLPFPKPTEERRRELVKDCNRYAEQAKIAVRNARRDANEEVEFLEKEGELTEDDLAREKKAIQKVTDEFTSKIDELLKVKTAEVMEI